MTSSSDGKAERVVVLAEDEPLLRAATALLLTSHGYLVAEAANALEAVAILEERAGSTKALFSDINMPGEMDGLELARFARARWPELTIVLTSGKSDHINAKLMDGIDAFLPKPYRPAEVIAVLG